MQLHARRAKVGTCRARSRPSRTSDKCSLRQKGVEQVEHYLDDYILMGGPHNLSCQRGLDILFRHARNSVFHSPTQTGGLLYPTDLRTLRLPTEKLDQLKEMLRVEWPKGVHTERAGIPCGQPEPCLQGCQATSFISSSIRATVNILHGIPGRGG